MEAVESIIMDIISLPMEDGVTFRIKQITEIMDEAEYPGVRVSIPDTVWFRTLLCKQPSYSKRNSSFL